MKDSAECWEWFWGGVQIQQERVRLSTHQICCVCCNVLLSFQNIMLTQEKLLAVSIMSFIWGSERGHAVIISTHSGKGTNPAEYWPMSHKFLHISPLFHDSLLLSHLSRFSHSGQLSRWAPAFLSSSTQFGFSKAFRVHASPPLTLPFEHYPDGEPLFLYLELKANDTVKDSNPASGRIKCWHFWLSFTSWRSRVYIIKISDKISR